MKIKTNNKLEALIHYITWKCHDPSSLGSIKLNKILWYSDTFHYLDNGKAITEVAYEKRQFGPVPKPKDFLAARDNLVSEGKIIKTEALYHNKPQHQLVALERPDLSVFTAEEISLVDSVIECICNSHTATSISELTHNVIWEAAEIGEEIPLYTAFAAQFGEVNGDDINWAKSQANRLNMG